MQVLKFILKTKINHIPSQKKSHKQKRKLHAPLGFNLDSHIYHVYATSITQ